MYRVTSQHEQRGVDVIGRTPTNKRSVKIHGYQYSSTTELVYSEQHIQNVL